MTLVSQNTLNVSEVLYFHNTSSFLFGYAYIQQSIWSRYKERSDGIASLRALKTPYVENTQELTWLVKELRDIKNRI